MDDCLFCKIVKKEVPAEIVFEDAFCVAFKDINPITPYHVLIVPRKHIDSAASISADDAALLGHMFLVISQITSDLGEGFRVVTNTGSHAGQTVDHLHFHILGGRNMTIDMA